MSRIRSIKPEAPQHRKVGALSDRAFRVWTVLLTQADDEGRLVCDASQVRVWGFSYHRDVTDAHVEEAIQEVARPGLIRLYTINGTRYAVFGSWADHQKINRPTPSKLPPPPSLLDYLSDRSVTDHGALTEDSRSPHGGLNTQVSQNARFTEPSVKTHGALTEDSRRIGSDRIGEDQGSDRIGEESRGEPDSAPRSLATPEGADSLSAPKSGVPANGTGSRLDALVRLVSEKIVDLENSESLKTWRVSDGDVAEVKRRLKMGETGDGGS